MQDLYHKISYDISRNVTHSYSTSFSIAVRCLDKKTRPGIYSIYGFGRLADEIVDTFHDFDKKELLSDFEKGYYKAQQHGISLNPVLHAFQDTVKRYNIPDDLIQAFLKSMKADLVKNGSYSKPEIDDYIYGSAEAVGLMCLCVFVDGDMMSYEELKTPAKKLGSAFQKVNFLRDLRNDIHILDRIYFPGMEANNFTDEVKQIIIRDIESDFSASLTGIKKLPQKVKFPVFTAYTYYLCLLSKIRRTKAEQLLIKRIRVNNLIKMLLLCKAFLMVRLRMV